MRRLLPLVLAVLAVALVAGSAGAQATGSLATTLSLADLDLSSASIHQAGPAAFYVRSVGVDGDVYSFLIERADADTWSVTGIVPESQNVLPPDAILDFATISAPDASSIAIEGVLVGDRVYGGTLTVGEDADLELAEQIRLADSDTINEARASALREIFAAETDEAIEAELAAQRAELEAKLTETPGGRSTPLTGEEVEALIAERDQLAGDIVGLVMENNELREERKTLREQIEELQERNSELAGDVETMTAEVGRLQELVEAYRATLGPEPGDGATREWAFPGDYVSSADLEAAAQAVTGELRSLDARVAALEEAASSLSDLEKALRTGVRGGLPATSLAAQPTGELPRTREAADPGTTEVEARAAIEAAEQAERLARVQAELADLLAENDALRGEQRRLEQRVLDEILDNGFVRIMRERLTRTLASGFSAGEPDTGAWRVSERSATQTEEDAYFAKLAMPVEQPGQPVLYSFRARSLDDGWVGMGLHLFVDGVERRRGYGMGSSLLVWFTRDPQERKTSTTYLQLYRSDSDVEMARVLDAAIPQSIDGFIDVDVLYEPASQYVTIAVDGTDRVRYRAWFEIDSGVEVALRTLGRAEFRDFEVSTMPATRTSTR
jgi:predicted nuclease with TOPRIM domain